ncbi:S-DNA-T family DNA segregation ATPase FtsK/SpoIIIE [Streptomyces sp. 846.5]|nr:FtsK/SpoIIIE domain-containing protein [Streptomyces sp. 846.5]TDU05401.1 S-DNA-T family DNA segregation ATPase FtsK/SpoIIIE [Streptomyces sp. 846.5]
MTDPVTEPTLGTVHDLADHRAGRTPATLTKPPVDAERTPIEGIVLPKQADQPPAPMPVAPVSGWVRSARVVRTVTTHPRTLTASRLVMRHSLYTANGALIVARRTWEGRTTARYERMMRSAEAAGQPEMALEWEQRAAAFRQGRHQRRMDMLTAPIKLAKSAVVGTLGLMGGLLLLGIALAIGTHHFGEVIAPTMALIHLATWVVFIVSVVWGPLVAIAPWAAVAGCWAVGAKRQAAPTWALPEDPTTRDVVPDEGAILDALRNLGIPAMNKAFKEGWQPRWVQPTTRMGNGWHTQLQLPLGVMVEMIAAKKAVLAHNLLRLPVEVWPTEPPKQPGVLDLWVADQGSLNGPVPPWPLLTEGTTDYFKGVPVAVSQRGEEVTARLMAANYMFGGIMGSGKSSLVIALLLGAMLDPLVEIDVYVMAYNVDYDPMRERLRTLVKGDDDEQVEAALEALRELRNEVTERGKILEELGGESVALTRELAQRDPRMRPRVVVFDECHELFEHKKYGAEAEDLAKKVMKKARKLGITLVWVTVSPTATSIPKEVTRNTSHGVAFAVGDYIANDGILGSGKYKAGVTATGLSPIENRGTAVTVGFTPKPFEVIRSYYVRKDASVDEISPIVARALALREGIEVAPAAPAAEAVDELADIAAVLGDAIRMRTQEVIQHLVERNRTHYHGWGFTDLTQVLELVDAAPTKYQGIMHVTTAKVLRALDERAEDTPEQ